MVIVPISRHVNPLSRSMDRLLNEQFFDRFFVQRAEAPSASATATTPTSSACKPATTQARTPALDVIEAEASYDVQMDLPGVTKENIKITIDGKRVTVTAEAASTIETKEGERLIHSERQSSSYARSFTLPVELNEAESSAKLEHGVLHLTLAKRGAGKTAQITVN